MSEKKKDNKIITITTPRGESEFFKLLESFTEEKLFEWQKELMARIEANEIYWGHEHEMNPVVSETIDECYMAERSCRRSFHNSSFGRYLANQIKCAGCGHSIDVPDNFPKGYPKDKMLCCGCVSAYTWYLGLGRCVVKGVTWYSVSCRKRMWAKFGHRILKAMRIQ